MHTHRNHFVLLTVFCLAAVPAFGAGSGLVLTPAPCGALPAQRQLGWHNLEFYGFIHFTVNTFTDKEWGFGDESPAVFNPTALDARQWARVARDAGMKGLILTAKHHDGFCLWPTRYTDHSVKGSPWKNGQGDVVGDLAEACRAAGLKFGVYLSPWDRHQPTYGRPEYLTYYRNQLQELLTQYGPTFEVWFDGANGGDGFYGGARETRRIDNATYYDWTTTWTLVRNLQPSAVMFSDAGPDIRWVGNERGVAFETSWLPMNRLQIHPGYGHYEQFAPGQPDGSHWVPPEVDVSIRPGWFYHPSEDTKVKSVSDLLAIYYASVGRGASLLLNLPPDRRGLIHEIDAQRLHDFRQVLDATFKTNLAQGAKTAASNVRSNAQRFAPGHAVDGDSQTYWATDDGVTAATITLTLPKPATFDRVVFQEFIALGQRVQAWTVEAEIDGTWKAVGSGTTVGYKRILCCSPVTTQRVRLNITQARACPTLANFALFRSPPDN